MTSTTFPPRSAVGQGLRVRRVLVAGRFKRFLLFVVMSVLAVIMLYPLYYMVDTSLRTNGQYQSGTGHSLEAWRELFDALPVARELANSAMIAISALVLIIA